MTPSEPSKWIAAIQAAAVYALTALALFWGVSFSFSAASVSPILQQVSLLPVQVAPPPKVAPKPKPESALNPDPAPSNSPDADIAIKKRQEEEEKRRKETERRKREEEVQKRKQEEAQKKHEEAQEREEAQKREKEKQKQLEQEKIEQKRRNKEQRAKELARQSELGEKSKKIEGQIRGRIERSHNHPQSVPEDADLEVVVVFSLEPEGEGRARLQGWPEIKESSGNGEYDESVQRAIMKVGSFPFPVEPELLEDFLVITLRMEQKK